MDRPVNRRLTILQHNVMTWTNKRHILSNIYHTIDPDIILLNETSILNDEPLKIFNYNVFRCNRLDERHSGIAIAIRKTIVAYIDDKFDQDFLTATIQTDNGPITIATGYIPPRLSFINTADFYRIFNKDHPVYFLGDLNAYHRTFDYTTNNFVGTQIVKCINDNRIKHIGPFFKTRTTNTTRRSPDIALSNNRAFHNIYLKPGPLTPSDHLPIIAIISSDPIQIPINPRLQFSKTDWTKYKRLLNDKELPILETATLEEIDLQIETWTNFINDATRQTTPLLNYRKIPGIQPNNRILKLQRIFKRLLTILETYGTSPIRQNFLTSLRNDISDEYKRLYNETWDEIIRKIDTNYDPSTFFKSIKRMTGSTTGLSPFLIHNNNRIYDPKQQEPIYRQHWQTIFSDNDPDDNNFNYDFINEIETVMTNRIDAITPHDTSDTNRFHFNDCPAIDHSEVLTAIRQLKNKAPGPNKLTARQLKGLPPKMTLFLTDIFNHSLSAGYFPDSFKYALMTLIPKSGTVGTNVKDKRPISLLNIDGKLFDKILNRRLTNFLTYKGLHNSRQHGFRQDRGTQTAIMTIHETIVRHLGLGHRVDIACRDVAKAFDKIWHLGLKFKLTEIGLHDCYVRVLCDYLDDRLGSIRIGNFIGPSFPLETGVPQGACLSPTLFDFYVHDLPTPLPDTDYVQYADDITQIIGLPGHPQTIAHNTATAIRQINSYEDKWKIQTNLTKFKILKINRHKTHPVIVDDQLIDYTNNIRLLGMTYSTFGLKPQVTSRRAIANNTLNRLQRFRTLSSDSKRRLYKTIVRPQLLYPIVPLNTLSTAQTRRLQQVQNRALRFIDNVTQFDCIPSQILHQRHDLPPINVYIHRRAIDTWTATRDKLPDIYHALTHDAIDNPRTNRHFHCSIVDNTSREPLPFYT